MIKLKIGFEVHNKEAVILSLEHIGHLISQNYPSGLGWSIEGEEESEPKYPANFISEEEEETQESGLD